MLQKEGRKLARESSGPIVADLTRRMMGGPGLVRRIEAASVLPLLGWPMLGRSVNDETPTSTLQINKTTTFDFLLLLPSLV